MTEPLVCAICLVNGREQMVKRAVASFRAQSYENKRLLLFDTGEHECTYEHMSIGRPSLRQIVSRHFPDLRGKSIGTLRNLAIDEACHYWQEAPDVIVHLDSDDWSNPQRFSEQVPLLQSSGADVVGYNELVFWDERYRDTTQHSEFFPAPQGMAWVYTRTRPTCALGTSLMYWRRTWQQIPFPDYPTPGNPQSVAEDTIWLNSGMKVMGVSGLAPVLGLSGLAFEPRLVASIHGSNTMQQSYSQLGRAPEFTRRPDLDDYCREQMRLDR